MSDTPINRIANAPKLYIAAAGVSLPLLTGTTITWANNEVYTLTGKTANTGGDYTLEVVYPDGSSETTEAIAVADDAAAIAAHLAALATLTASDVTVTGGPANAATPIVITFIGAYANTPMTINLADSSTGEGHGITSVNTAHGRLWTELPDVAKDYKVKRTFKSKEHLDPLTGAKTGSTTLVVGVDSVAVAVEESNLGAFNIGLLSTLLALTPAGASQPAMYTLTDPTPSQLDATLFQLAAQKIGPTGGWGQVEHFLSVKRDLAGDETSAIGAVREVDVAFEVFSVAGVSRRKYEYVSAATS